MITVLCLENEKNLQSDQWRVAQIERHTAKRHHPYKKFSTGVYIITPYVLCNNVVCCQGNRETLDTIPSQKGINVREELLKFHSTHYSSNLMCLSVLGRG